VVDQREERDISLLEQEPDFGDRSSTEPEARRLMSPESLCVCMDCPF
jgi:hypothetical protein